MAVLLESLRGARVQIMEVGPRDGLQNESVAISTADKIALVHLVRRLEREGYGMIDCQMRTAHLARFGAREIPRAEFKRRLVELVNYPRTDWNWRPGDDLFE